MTRWPPPPTLPAAFYKAHGLGNDYLVFAEGEEWAATPANVARVCDRHVGIGSDGIVVVSNAAADAGDPRRVTADLRMFNPDGGEFERSGNGLRVLASWIATRFPGVEVVDVTVGGDAVQMRLHGMSGAAHDISVQMGRARLGPDAVALDASVLLTGPGGEALDVVPVSVGNPHLVVVPDSADPPVFSEETLARLGPHLTAHPALRHGANVQLAVPVGHDEARAFIWERGVGRTSASGTSSCAVAVAMVASGRLDPGEITVTMPGGALQVGVSADLDVVLRGPVEEVLDGRLRPALLATFEPGR